MMHIDAVCSFSFDTPLEREAMAQIGEGLAALFDIDVPRKRIGLIVVSDNAGSATALRFWTEALRVGVDFASPELFPWCLANAPCGALARHFHITGPNATLLGAGDALSAALDSAADMLVQQRVDCAMVVALSFAYGSNGDSGQVLALRVCADVDACGWDAGLLADAADLPLRAGMDLLRRQLESRANLRCAA